MRSEGFLDVLIGSVCPPVNAIPFLQSSFKILRQTRDVFPRSQAVPGERPSRGSSLASFARGSVGTGGGSPLNCVPKRSMGTRKTIQGGASRIACAWIEPTYQGLPIAVKPAQ